ncbi:hypothetical protein C8P64_2484 [Christiangramia gaetbulicola]|uniref:DUF192 domain-containing protein n=1 Tax=Christiangramia gaetbulicola TaxID=703340 RepID=A0A2T6AE33_9FLAO|nr:DUF192 domain-containing protein [Christiangramia gaetbulicola]PTX42070.1 hypothetical protein C8P64_2484 [Christiangramia gaetbulicola]
MKKRILSLASLSLFLSLSFTSCGDDDKKEEVIETDPITFTKEGELYMIKASGDTLKKLDIELAESDYEHQTGLMYRESMEDDQGMLFVYDDARVRSFYMKNTYIPLDIIYYAADSTLVSIQKNATPRDETSLPSEGPTKFVLEINGGLSDAWGVEQGDKISFKKLD